jgi:hypothetical protein
MRKVAGGFNELQELVATTRNDGEWIEQKQQKQYRAYSGAILNYWESTGTVNFQGPPSAAKEFEAAVFQVNAGNARASKAQPNSARTAIDDAALRSLTRAIIQNRIGPIFDEESALLRKIVQQCMFDLCERLGLVSQATRRD